MNAVVYRRVLCRVVKKKKNRTVDALCVYFYRIIPLYAHITSFTSYVMYIMTAKCYCRTLQKAHTESLFVLLHDCFMRYVMKRIIFLHDEKLGTIKKVLNIYFEIKYFKLKIIHFSSFTFSEMLLINFMFFFQLKYIKFVIK